ncbi:MAG: hypothetical protein Q7V63_01600 [Gammaproteobacteria bacterium]|nr:hypothetical protein [Gammaproteobacteria bacterium]
MKRSLKVIAELGSDENKALLIEMPQDMIRGLKVALDGTVDTKCLLGMLMLMEQEAVLEQDNEEPLHEQLDLLLNIYDQSRAVEFNSKAAS